MQNSMINGGEDVDQIILDMTINRRVRRYELAQACGVSPATFSYKMKKNVFSVADLRNIAEYLDCDLQIQFVPRQEMAAGTK